MPNELFNIDIITVETSELESDGLDVHVVESDEVESDELDVGLAA